jgi:hypothetical protein
MMAPNNLKINFVHRQSAHCESGVTANLLFHHGINMSESLAFGIGAALFFGYFPFIRINGMPLTTFRGATGQILKRVTKGLGVQIKRHKFQDPEKAMNALDRIIDQGIPVGMQTGVYWLPYFPPALRFHFNAHNIIVYGKEDTEYLVSDPVFDEPVVCSRTDLMKARFAQGALAPKGKMYYLTSVPDHVDMATAIVRGIRDVCKTMLKIPFPLIGVRGIRFLARRIENWPEKLGESRASLNIGHIIRMQEEIGTGGAGFRFIYAAFLQEAAEILGEKRLLNISRKMTEIGDRWREFALFGVRNCKGRALEGNTYPAMADILCDCANQEDDGNWRSMARICIIWRA